MIAVEAVSNLGFLLRSGNAWLQGCQAIDPTVSKSGCVLSVFACGGPGCVGNHPMISKNLQP